MSDFYFLDKNWTFLGQKLDNFNMMYSDYYGAVQNDAVAYGKLAKKFLEDKDAKEGKALYYYLNINK